MDPLVDPLLGNYDHSSISFPVKMGFKISNITFYRKVYLRSRVNWSRVGDDLCNFNWGAVYNAPNPVSELNKKITSLINRCVPSKVIRRKVNDKVWFNKNCVDALHNKQNAYHL